MGEMKGGIIMRLKNFTLRLISAMLVMIFSFNCGLVDVFAAVTSGVRITSADESGIIISDGAQPDTKANLIFTEYGEDGSQSDIKVKEITLSGTQQTFTGAELGMELKAGTKVMLWLGDVGNCNPTGDVVTIKATQDKIGLVLVYGEGREDTLTRYIGDAVGKLPSAYKENATFVGWYYDSERTKAVGENDIITESMMTNGSLTLYAELIDAEKLEPEVTPRFASSLDVAGDFTMNVTSSEPMSADEVKAGITAKNLNSPDDTDLIIVTGKGNSFVICGNNGGFEEGASFKITLDDERLTFEGQPQYVRNYNFTTSMEEVVNVTLSKDMIYIPMEQLSNITNDGQSVESLSISLYQADASGGVRTADLTTGTFTYTAQQLEVGDLVTVYEGRHPQERTLDTPDSENGDIAYIEITEKAGSKYSYKNAEAEDVIFKPDILPVPVNEDKDENDNTVTIDNEWLDYSDDVYANVQLDSTTTVDEGDFVMLYDGDFTTGNASIAGYGKITGVTDNGDNSTIVYVPADWDTVQAAMDIYSKTPISGDEMLEGVDTSAIEQSVEQQAIESGFAQEAADYLADVALTANSVEELQKNLNIKSASIKNSAGNTLNDLNLEAMATNSKVEIEASSIKAKLSTALQHFEGYDGVRLLLEVGVSITITPQSGANNQPNGTDNQIKIELTGQFEQELRLAINVSSKAVWKVWGIFPYIAEYRVTASVDMFDYTGIAVEATIVSQDKDEADGWSDKLTDQSFKEFVKTLRQTQDNIDKYNNVDLDVDLTDALVDKYTSMLETDSDWINLVERQIFSQEFHVIPILPIIAIEIDVSFIISANMVVSLGFDFYYMNAKSYVYTIDVFAGKVYNDVIDIQEETYEFSFYVMGTLGLRAGIEAKIKVGLISTKLASVGFSAECGAYVRLWGFFYYELHYTASQGREEKSSGALYIEVGIYLEVNFEAQAFCGTYSTELELCSEEWPIYKVGRRECILDFVTQPKSMPKINLKQYIRSATISDDVFDMSYLDLKEGEMDSKMYDDSDSYFRIEMTNPAFSYNYKTNTITATPAEGVDELDGEMIITWKPYPLQFLSRPIQRRIAIHWDNYRDGYVIVPYTNGGNYIPIIVQAANTPVTQPADPTKKGYNFNGWYDDEKLTAGYSFPSAMPSEDNDIYSSWSYSNNTPYRVEHYLQKLGSSEYDLQSSEQFTGTTNSVVTPEVKQFVGYTSPQAEKLTISADGSAVMRYYYDRNTYTVTFDPGEVGGESDVYTYKYGATVTAPVFGAKGYVFNGWDKTVANVMGDSNVTYTAQWTKEQNTDYRIEYYVQQSDGRYKLQETVNAKAATGDEISAASIRKDSTYAVNNINFKDVTVKGEPVDKAVVTGDGKTVIKVNYARDSYNVTFVTNNGTPDITKPVYYNGKITPPEVTSDELDLDGWFTDVSCSESSRVDFGTMRMPAYNVTLYAKWTKDKRTYTISFDTDGGTDVASITQLYNTPVTAPENPTKAGYTFIGWDKDIPELMPGENITLKAQWMLNRYTITYENMSGATINNPTSYTVEDSQIVLEPALKTGYTFEGWYSDSGLTKEVSAITVDSDNPVDITLYAKWTANVYSVTFDNGLSAGHFTQTQLFTYDTQQALDKNTFTNNGFVFAGWTTVKGSGTVNYADGAVVTNLVAKGNINLYAVWKPISYTITYSDVTIGAGSTNNPTSYNIESNDIILSNPVNIKSGYQFLGWYNGNTKVTAITKGSTGNVSLVAKWAHGGTFSVAYVSTSGTTSTYKITRTLPTGTVATSDPQNVYYRTLNGTAVGGTASAINFLHVGGEDVFATFTSSDGNGSTKTFTVTGENANATIMNNTATGFVSSSSSTKYYNVELYKVVSTQGNCTGSVGGQNMAKRLLTVNDSYKINTSIFGWNSYNRSAELGERLVNDKGFNTDKNKNARFYTNPYSVWSSSQKAYLQNTIDKNGLYYNMELKEDDDGYQLIQFTTDTGITDQWKFEIKPGGAGTSWRQNCHLPNTGGTGTGGGDVQNFNHEKAGLSFINDGAGGYLEVPKNVNSITVDFDASGNGADDWRFKNVLEYVKPIDNTEPVQIGTAPVAFGKYKKGDTIRIAVVFNEIVNTGSNVTLGSISGLNISKATLVDGYGTCVLHFDVVLGADVEVTPTFNTQLASTKPIKGNVYDMVG